MSFETLGLCEPILHAAAGAGYETPTPIQTKAIPHVIAGRDLLGCAQTGTGKTAAFAMPILHRLQAGSAPASNRAGSHERRVRPIRALILSPTRELAAQIEESFRVYGKRTKLRQTVIFGGVSQQRQVQSLQAGVDIVVATPGRLLDLVNQRHLDLSSIEVFVLDEADHMLDLGFLPDVRRIIAKLPRDRQTLFFSATMPTDIRRLAEEILVDPVRIKIAPVKETSDLIQQSVYHVAQAEKPTLLAQYLSAHTDGTTLVFTRTKRGADAVVRKLAQYAIPAEAIHGNKSQNARQRTLANFKSGRTKILVATDIAARGIDVSGISHVINYDLPDVPETYVHRIGRTGRAGDKGFAVAFCQADDRGALQDIQRLLGYALPQGRQLPENTRKRVVVVETRRPAAEPLGARPTTRSARTSTRSSRPSQSSDMKPAVHVNSFAGGKRQRASR